jgi:hypothetical protein
MVKIVIFWDVMLYNAVKFLDVSDHTQGSIGMYKNYIIKHKTACNSPILTRQEQELLQYEYRTGCNTENKN